MKNSLVVVTERCYTDAQIADIKRQAVIEYKKKRRMQRVEEIKFSLAFGAMTIGCPLLMLLHWLAMGY